MKEMSGDSYEASAYAKALAVAGPKDGKSTYLIGQLLGVWPTSKNGAVVTRPEHLHVITADSAALKGVVTFLTKHCGASDAAMKFHVLNMEDDVRRVAATENDWDYAFYNGLLDAYRKVQDSAARGGVHAVLTSSLTGIAAALQRALFGKPGLGGKRGAGGDMAKWAALSAQIAEVRNYAQMDMAHCIWEGHIDRVTQGKAGEEETKDTIGLMGSAGRNFAYNVSEVFRIRRNVGAKYKTRETVDQMYIDTQPSLSFMNNGRGFSELDPKEVDLTATLTKLGYKVGGWGKRKEK